MPEEFTIKVTDDGKVSSSRIVGEREANSKIDLILELINDPNTPLGDIKRLIAAELATVNRELIKFGSDMSLMEASKLKGLSEQVKALRELGKELGEADVLAKKDYLNFDGPKIKYVLGEYRQGAQDAMKEAGLDPATVNSVLKHWRDIMGTREAEIRRNTDNKEFDK